jgi:glyoxylase-like metal-dependent hydrolase (beta-lactamase superfamily II)
MRVHHLNCATLCPFGERFIHGDGGLLSPSRMVCHCLVVESDDGLVLVDTGLGHEDVAHPYHRLGRVFVDLMRPRLDPHETAAYQVERLGFSVRDVRHIVVTHLDLDHAGGLSDFPQAKVHLHAREHEAAMKLASFHEKRRYRSVQWAHGPDWTTHREEGERWFGFESVTVIPAVGTDLLLIPLFGHTHGHCGVAVRAEDGWLLHAGDAYFHRDEVRAEPRDCPPALETFQRLIAMDGAARMRNQRRLRALSREHASEVRIFSAHDTAELREAIDLERRP